MFKKQLKLKRFSDLTNNANIRCIMDWETGGFRAAKLPSQLGEKKNKMRAKGPDTNTSLGGEREFIIKSF